jgi:lipopolysaccharide transport system permease protein
MYAHLSRLQGRAGSRGRDVGVAVAVCEFLFAARADSRGPREMSRARWQSKDQRNSRISAAWRRWFAICSSKPAMNALREIVGEQWEYRELFWRMTLRDLQLRYKQSVMGFGWAVFMPLVNTAIFSVIFMRVAPIDVGVPYPVYAFCGLVAWNFFASALRFSVVSLTTNTSLVTKLYFPREVFPFSAVAISLVDCAVACLALAAVMAYYGVAPGWSILLLPVVVSVQVLFTAAIALLLAMGNLFYRDVKYLFEIVISVAMFASSVVYPVDRVGGTLGVVMALNPMTHLIDAFRAVVVQGAVPGAGFAVTAVVTVVAFVGAWLLFHASEFAFAESI